MICVCYILIGSISFGVVLIRVWFYSTAMPIRTMQDLAVFNMDFHCDLFCFFGFIAL